MSRLSRMIDWVDDRLNPVVVKELRQAVRGNYVPTGLMMFLAAMMGALGWALVQESDGLVGPELGRETFYNIYVVLLSACCAALPALTAGRAFVERMGDTVDMTRITTLPRWKVVRGKMVAAMVLAALVFMSWLPFALLTIEMRGIDASLVAMLTFHGYLAVMRVSAVGLFAGTLRLSSVFGLVALAMAGYAIFKQWEMLLAFGGWFVDHGLQGGLLPFPVMALVDLAHTVWIVLILLALAAVGLGALRPESREVGRGMTGAAWALTWAVLAFEGNRTLVALGLPMIFTATVAFFALAVATLAAIIAYATTASGGAREQENSGAVDQ